MSERSSAKARAKERAKTDLGRLNERAEGHESVEQHAFIDVGVEVTDEQVGSDVDLLPIRRGLREKSTERSAEF